MEINSLPPKKEVKEAQGVIFVLKKLFRSPLFLIIHNCIALYVRGGKDIKTRVVHSLCDAHIFLVF